MPTGPQIKRLYALATNAGLTAADVHAAIDRLYGRRHTKYLTDVEYERFTAMLSRGDIRPEVMEEPEPDIAPIVDGKWIGNKGAVRTAVGIFSREGLLWPDARGIDAGTVGDMLDCIRLYRRSFRRITLEQARALVEAWTAYPLAVWRDAASRYLVQHTTKDEKYFAGILRRVAREHAEARPAAAH